MPFFFIQLADPQLGMFSFFSGLTEEEIEERRQRGINARKAPKVITGFDDETRLFSQAIEAANRLRPAFVVVCGDMTHEPEDEDQVGEVKRIAGLLDRGIPLYWVAGNHDAGNTPTPETLARYRERYGVDNYSFDHGGSHFVVLNSCVAFDAADVPDEWDALVKFLQEDLQSARDSGCEDIIVFMHHPLFLDHRDEEDGYFVIPKERRSVILEILKAQGVSAVFAGHLHRNVYASDGELQIIATAAVGYPLGDDPSGLRVVRMYGDAIQHDYYGFDEVPESVEL
ncbi:MAG: metallophosphoesterase [Chloroflexi bacterium]|nr:metallophosphoesterase [Chloroflexota bacterium]